MLRPTAMAEAEDAWLVNFFSEILEPMDKLHQVSTVYLDAKAATNTSSTRHTLSEQRITGRYHATVRNTGKPASVPGPPPLVPRG